MRGPDIEDYLQHGLHGPLETKPDERRRFLGTLRERVIIALTKVQMREPGTYPEVETAMKEYPQATLLLNGHMDYTHISKYIRLAHKYRVKTSIVTNTVVDSELGLVLALDYAINKRDIFVKKGEKQENTKQKTDKKGLFSVLGQKFFKR